VPFAPPSLALVKLAQCRTGGIKDGVQRGGLQVSVPVGAGSAGMGRRSL
jgi:hypothetical protein